MFIFRKLGLRRLRSQLIVTFLVGFLGIGIAIGLPVIVLISRQASSQAQLLLNQAAVASRAFMSSEQSDLQSLALLISQRPTLTRLLEEQDASLESYLNTLRESANLDLILICSGGQAITEIDPNLAVAELCQVDSQSRYAVLPSADDLYLYTAADLTTARGTTYKVLVGKRASLILAELQRETGLLFFLVWENQAIASSESFIEATPGLAASLLSGVNRNEDLSLERRSFRIDEHQYLLSNLEIDLSLGINLISALNVDDQIAVQQNLSRTLILGLFFIILIASILGVWLSQRISQPIVHLANAADEFRQRNLDSSVSVQSSVWEINQLANTLEDGRIALQHSLQQLQAEKAWIEHLLNSIVEGMLTLDGQNRITFASAGITKITGYGPDQIIGRKIDDVFRSAEGELDVSSQLPAVGQQRRISVKLADGQERLLSISKSELVPPEASSSNRALVIRDVSNEEYIHRLLGDFMANITHEFRTPLAALEASSELMLDNLDNLSHEELEELLVSLNLGIINLQTLIDNLIEAASIEAGRFKVSLQTVSFHAILEDALKIILPLSEKYALRVLSPKNTESIFVIADHRRTVQALVNLLSNAVKHSPENGCVQIKHSVAGGNLRVEVMDEGSGVPVGQRGSLFRRFSHLDSSNERARQGAGLGLSVVKEIVEAQRGEVGITDLTAGGTSFWFTLPLADKSESW